MLNRPMPDPLEAVTKRMQQQGISAYRLVQMLKGKRPRGRDVPPATVYEFLRGETAINSADLGLIMDALEMEFGAKGGSRQ